MNCENTHSGVYAIENSTNGKRYVGSAMHLRRRCQEHLRSLRANRHHSRHLQNAWNKYGEATFSFSVLEECPVDQLVAREQHWIEHLETSIKGYNIAPTAGSTLGVRYSAESRARLSAACSTPLAREQRSQRMRETLADPTFREYVRLRAVAGMNRPEVRRRKSENAKKQSAAPEERARRSARTRQLWDDPAFRSRMQEQGRNQAADPEERARRSARGRAQAANPAERERRAQRMRELWADPAERERRSQRSKAAHNTPEYLAGLAERTRSQWADPEYRAKHTGKRRNTVNGE